MHIYDPGAIVQRREVLHGRLWMNHPVTVVADNGTLLAVRLDPGSTFTFHDHSYGLHPWSPQTRWASSVVLQLHQADTPYGVWKFFTPAGRFLRWYINFEAPIIRHEDSYDTDDHGLDLIVYPDGARSWKDVADLHHFRSQGRLDLDDVGRVLAAAAEVTDLLDSGGEWWKPWTEWTPVGTTTPR